VAAEAESGSPDPKALELAEIVREIQTRVRARYSSHPAGATAAALPDFMPLVHARDAAEAKVAAIGTVNPRPGGALNNLIQNVKRALARGLEWFVRDQVEFNRSMLACVEAQLEAGRETNRILAALLQESAELSQLRSEQSDIRAHWLRWREDWERKLLNDEVHYLRSVADLQAGFQHRTLMLEDQYREIAKHQYADFKAALDRAHADFNSTLDRAREEIQKRLWADLERIRLEYERLIHQELRLLRQRGGTVPVPENAVRTEPPGRPDFDYARFSERFRGSEEYVREKQRVYIPYFQGKNEVLDLGCGRGEFLELMKEISIDARGIDTDPQTIALCRNRGLAVEVADIFDHLTALPDRHLDGIFCAQVAEHLPPERLPELIRLAGAKLRREGVLVIETPNPECLAIFATHFYLDPTHTRPIPPALMVFYLEEFGFGNVRVHRLSPAAESIPALSDLPPEFRRSFFGGLDYGAVGVKL
jgi:O-antigen chain-terminating methyltransferase